MAPMTRTRFVAAFKELEEFLLALFASREVALSSVSALPQVRPQSPTSEECP